MTDQITDTLRHREILFRGPHPDSRQAHSATLILSDIEGIVQVAPKHDLLITISYDLQFVSLQIIEEALSELGFHLDNNLLIQLKRALFHYSEEIAQAQLGYTPNSADTQVFIQKYRERAHGCRDERPEHWRHYL